MEMVSASKMRRAQQRVLASRPYAERLERMIGDLAALEARRRERSGCSLCWRIAKSSKIEVILITPDTWADWSIELEHHPSRGPLHA